MNSTTLLPTLCDIRERRSGRVKAQRGSDRIARDQAAAEVVGFYLYDDEAQVEQLARAQANGSQLQALMSTLAGVFDIENVRVDFVRGPGRIAATIEAVRRSRWFGFHKKPVSVEIEFEILPEQEVLAPFLDQLYEACGHDTLGYEDDCVDVAYGVIDDAFHHIGPTGVSLLLDQIEINKLTPNAVTGVVTCLMIARGEMPRLGKFLRKILNSPLAENVEFCEFIRRKVEFLTENEGANLHC